MSLTREQIEEARTELKGIFSVLADAGVKLGKPAEQVALVVNESPKFIDSICDLALRGLEREGMAEYRYPDRCPHCSFNPTSHNDYCSKHRPAAQKERT